MQVSIGSRPYSSEAFTGKPSRLANRPLLPTGAQKKLRFFQSAQKILKTSRTNMVKSLITNINLFFLFWRVVLMKSKFWAVG
jgi:hypothetical protein